MLRGDLGEAGGVIAMEDLSRRDPVGGTGEVLACRAARPFTDTRSGGLFPGDDRSVGEDWTGYWTCCTTVFIGEEIALYERAGEPMSLEDLTEAAGEPPMTDLMGDAELMDQTDFSGETQGVLDEELERDPKPDLAWLGA